MKPDIKRIGVLTSGGDAPGMNAAVRGVVYAALHRGVEVLGIYDGYRGLLEKNIKALSYDDVADVLTRGGTFLRTARCPEFTTEDGVARGAAAVRELALDALVVIGGDGSFRGALDLAAHGVPVVGIPGTIDNDIGCTEYTIGFDTAMTSAMDAIDRIRDTAASHGRCCIIEVMGRHAGYIAYHTALAGGAEVVLLPEEPADFEAQVAVPLKTWWERGRRNFVVVAAEGVAGLAALPAIIEGAIGVKPTYSVLGYIQRGGHPTLRDRSTALRMGECAVAALCAGQSSIVVAEQAAQLVTLPIREALTMKSTISTEEIRAVRVLTNG